MQAKVYHVDKPSFRSDDKPAWPHAYSHVATVDSDDLETIFNLTNTVSYHWWKNPLVTAHFEGEGCRSTSVGDIVVFGDGRPWRCAPFGWVQINEE